MSDVDTMEYVLVRKLNVFSLTILTGYYLEHVNYSLSMTTSKLEIQKFVRSAKTSVWKVRFQQLKHFPVANNELFHTVPSKQKLFSTQNGLLAWILIYRVIWKNGQI